MGIFKKLKDVLFDIEEEDVPTAKEPEKTFKRELPIEDSPIKEIKIPIKEELKETKTEPIFNFPIDFDEPNSSRAHKNLDAYDFDERNNSKRNIETGYKNTYVDSKKKEAPKPFRPSPVISPVYGILDQNYTKDDVIIKTDIGVKSPDLDEVRRKAYGLNNKKNVKKNEKEDDEFTEPLKGLDEILKEKDNVIAKIEITESSSTTKIIEDDELPDEPYNDDENTIDETNTLETDLFNLIDSMYEERKEKEEE